MSQAQQSRLPKNSKTSVPGARHATPPTHRSAPAPLIKPGALAQARSASPAQLLQLQQQYGNRAVQRMIQRTQTEKLQDDSTIGLEGGAVEGDLQNQINTARGSGQPLARSAGAQMGGALGADLSGVRVHTDAKSDTLNRSLGAQAFTLGSDVFFSKGAYNPGTHSGKRLLAHELTHVVQQGSVPSNQVQTKLTVGPARDKYEQEADRVANEVLALGQLQPGLPGLSADEEQTASRSEGGTVHRSAQSKITSAGPNIQRDTGFQRFKRKMGRFFRNKKLPPNTYRWDQRSADVIAQVGFEPRLTTGTIALEEHVNNVLAGTTNAAKMHSQWVSTGAYGMLKKLDPTFAQQAMNSNLYKIDTHAAKQSGGFKDANAHFDKIGVDRPYASQREWVKLGGVPAGAVIKWMPGMDFINQYDFTNGAPDEANLQNWQDMP